VTSMASPLIKVAPELHELGMEAAHARAEWELGDRNWADILVGAYLDPLMDRLSLLAEQRRTD
jgi:hypothetical protein